MFTKTTFSVVVAALVLPLTVLAQDGAEGPIFVPFDYSAGEPMYASLVGSSGGSTTYALIDGPRSLAIEPGPATLIQAGATGAMIYIDQAKPTATYAGECELVAPVAMCTLFPQESGTPGGGGGGTVTPPGGGGTGGGTGGTGGGKGGNGGSTGGNGGSTGGNGGSTGGNGGSTGGTGGTGGNTGGNTGGTGGAMVTGVPALLLAVTTAVLGFGVGVALLN